MKRIFDSNDLAIIISATAPCPGTYYEISEALNKTKITTDGFKQCIRFYSSKESRKQVSKLKALLNKLARKSDKKKKADMKNHFSISCNYELEFWNMAYSFLT